MSYLAVVDYGAGNLMSVRNSLDYLGFANKIADTASLIADASGVILPGVGAFPDAMESLRESGLQDEVRRAATQKPFLGICLGMQMLFEHSEEVRPCTGLGLLSGEIRRIPTAQKLPQIGWNGLHILRENPLTAGLREGDCVYFVHSLMAVPTNPKELLCTTDYGVSVPAIVGRGNLYGCQFHPEKSGDIGLHILRNFANLTEASV